MKTIKLVLTITAVAIVAIATAVEKPKMNVIPLNANRAIVSITNENPAYFELSVKAENGELVYFKQSKKPLTDYQKVFDFENLENGNYTLDLKVNDTKLSRNVQIASNKMYIGESMLRFDPYFTFEDNLLKFSYLNFDKGNFSIKIYDYKGLVYQAKVGNDFTISTGYDLSKLEAGKYEVVLSSYKNEFSYSLEK